MKSGNLFEDFVWRRACGGYIWKPVLGGLLLVPADGKDAAEEAYKLGDKSSTGSLFMQFARLEQTPEAFLAFANQFGTLGYPVTVDYFKVSDDEFGFTSAPPSRLSERPRSRATTYSFWKGDPPPEFATPTRGSKIRGEFFSLEDDSRPGPSWLHHVRLILWLMEARRSPAKSSDSPLANDADVALRDAVWLTLDGKLAGRMTPTSLVGALWLQAALARGKEYRNCPVCDTPIEISRTGGARADAVFCSDRCKSKDYRRRRAAARSLHDKGLALRKIAKQVETNPATVKGWLK